MEVNLTNRYHRYIYITWYELCINIYISSEGLFPFKFDPSPETPGKLELIENSTVRTRPSSFLIELLYIFASNDRFNTISSSLVSHITK